MNELIKRVLVAVIGIPAAGLLFYAGDIYFTFIVAIFASIGLYEFYRLSSKKKAFPNIYVGIAINLILIFSVYYLTVSESTNHFLGFMIIIWPSIILLLLILELFRGKPNPLLNISTTLSGLLYITLSFLCLILLREFHISFLLQPEFSSEVSTFGRQLSEHIDKTWTGWLLLAVFSSVWVCDSAAYFVGKAIGKNKLFVRISPNKTWEGAAGGFVGAIITFMAFAHYLLPGLRIYDAILIGAIIGSIGQIGDLAESMFKRDAGVKDSPNLFPGHGGALDRFDSIMFTAPAVYIYLVLVVLI